jgi:hypothetical protein
VGTGCHKNHVGTGALTRPAVAQFATAVRRCPRKVSSRSADRCRPCPAPANPPQEPRRDGCPHPSGRGAVRHGSPSGVLALCGPMPGQPAPANPPQEPRRDGCPHPSGRGALCHGSWGGVLAMRIDVGTAHPQRILPRTRRDGCPHPSGRGVLCHGSFALAAVPARKRSGCRNPLDALDNRIHISAIFEICRDCKYTRTWGKRPGMPTCSPRWAARRACASCSCC